MSGTNKYGLARHIPADVARSVRQSDGFGCVVCDHALIKYDHLEPEFHDARERPVGRRPLTMRSPIDDTRRC
jgi:hypothetical protein